MTKAERSQSVLLVAVVALGVTGAWVSGQMVKQHADLWGASMAEQGFFGRLCQASEAVNLGCEGVAESGWSRIMLPLLVPSADRRMGVHWVAVPVAFLGLAYFVFLAVWFGFVGRPRPYGRRWQRLPKIVSLCGLAVSTFYLGVMASGLAPRCLGCLVVHAINLPMVYLIWRLRLNTRVPGLADMSVVSLPDTMARLTLTSREAVGVIAMALIVIVGLWAYRSERLALQEKLDRLMPYKTLVATLQQDPGFLLREHLAQQAWEIPPRSTEPQAGAGAEVVVFTDFTCPPCYCKSQWIREHLAGVFQDHLIVRVRHFPLCRDCRDQSPSAHRTQACEAACAAEAARILGGEEAFWRMHDLLFKHRKNLGSHAYRSLAAQIGLDTDAFQREMEGDAVRRIVSSDIGLAEHLDVHETPTLFFNGRRVTPLLQTPVFWEAVACPPSVDPSGVLASASKQGHEPQSPPHDSGKPD